MKTKDVLKVHRFFNEPIEHGELFKMTARYSRFKDIISETYGSCYEIALKEVNKLII